MNNLKSGNVQKDLNFFDEDVVELIKKKKKKKKKKPTVPYIGVIECVGNDEPDSDYESNDELEDDEIKIRMVDGEYRTVKLKSVRLLDRALSHGNVVKKAKQYLKGKNGVVVGLNLVCYVKKYSPGHMSNSRGSIIVNSSFVKEINNFDEKFCVYKNSHLCKFKSVLFNLTLKFKNGDKCTIENVDYDEFFSEKEEKRIWDETTPFFVGQKFKFGERKEYLINGKWENDVKYDIKTHKTGIVIDVSIGDVKLDYKIGKKLQLLNEINKNNESIDKNEIVCFQYFKKYNYSIGDYVLVHKKLFDVVAKNDDYNEWSNTNMKINELYKSNNNDDYYVCRVMRTSTMCDVLWQDNTVEKGIKSIDLHPIKYSEEKDFFPHDIVKYFTNSGDDEKKKSIGIISSVDCEKRICILKPIKNIKEKEEIFNKSLTFSCFDIEDCNDYAFEHGDLVIKIPKKSNNNNENDKDKDNEEEWIGEVIGKEGLYVDVCYVNGIIKREIYNEVINVKTIFPDIEDDSDSDSDSSDDDDDEDDDEDDSDEDKGEEDGEDEIEDEVNEFINELYNNGNEEDEKVSFKKNVNEYIPEDCDDDNDGGKKDVKMKEESNDVSNNYVNEKVNIVPTKVTNQFYFVNEFKDHHFGNKNMKDLMKSGELIKTILSEMKILQSSLPKNIYVFASKKRLDCLRAVIRGSKATPYFNFCFVFDIFLPQFYGSVPPIVYHHSYGIEINPNLYKDGDICLSLLGTWEGKEKSESWVPKKSNIFQVLLSLSSLVLTEFPYFNEAGYGRQKNKKEGKKNSDRYNEDVIINVIKHQIKFFQNIPNGIGHVIINQHFKAKSVQDKVTSILECHLNGEKMKENYYNLIQPSSEGLKLTLKKLIPILKKKIKKSVENFEDVKK